MPIPIPRGMNDAKDGEERGWKANLGTGGGVCKALGRVNSCNKKPCARESEHLTKNLRPWGRGGGNPEAGRG